MAKQENLKPKNDVIFKNLFSKNGNEEMLAEIIEEGLKIKVEEIEIEKEVELSKMHVNEKYGRLDLRVIVNKNIMVIIEMQRTDNCNMTKRALFYAGKLIGSSLKSKETYDNIKDIYMINILNYNILETEEYSTDTVIVDSKYRKYIIIEGIKFYFIELPKFREQVKEPKTKLGQWLAFIDYENKEMVNMAIARNKLVEKAQKDYEYLTGDAATRRLEELREKAIYDEYFAYERGEEIGIEKGEARGKIIGEKHGKIIGEREGRIKTAIEMIKDNVNLETIAKYTGLNEKELEELVLEKV